MESFLHWYRSSCLLIMLSTTFSLLTHEKLRLFFLFTTFNDCGIYHFIPFTLFIWLRHIYCSQPSKLEYPALSLFSILIHLTSSFWLTTFTTMVYVTFILLNLACYWSWFQYFPNFLTLELSKFLTTGSLLPVSLFLYDQTRYGFCSSYLHCSTFLPFRNISACPYSWI